MKAFMDRNFMLTTDTAKKIYARGAKDTPIFDWHCHLSPKEIYENKEPENIAELWLSGDHYKWRAMRSYGIDEKYITGDASDYEKFLKYAEVIPYCIGNPIYHWTHMELQRYFHIYEPLSPVTADYIWEHCNAKIKKGDFSPRALIKKSNVKALFTTDDPTDSLEYHELIEKDDTIECKVFPAFRPDKALDFENPDFLPWLKKLDDITEVKIDSFENLLKALTDRMEYFAKHGCRASDHSLSYCPFVSSSYDELEAIFKKLLNGEELSKVEGDKYLTALLQHLGREYSRLDWVMELHLGAMINNNTKMYHSLGENTGFDGMDDNGLAFGLSHFLDSLEEVNLLPKTVLFALNPKDYYVLGAMLGSFQNNEAKSKIQLGSAWWFNDNHSGMREHMQALANLGVFGKFIGMVTDSRSFLSYPRHEYFRRILCGFLGELVENGEYPDDIQFLSQMVEDISYNNAKDYFGF